MNILPTRLFGPFDPAKEFKEGKTVLILGDVSTQEELEAATIESNFEKTEPSVSFPGRFYWVERPFSKWEICKLTLSAMKDRVILARVIVSAVVCALGACLLKWSISSVASYYQRYKEGGLIIVYYRGIPHSPRPLNLFDIIGWGMHLTILNLACAALCILPVWTAVSAIRERLRQERHHQVAIGDVSTAPSSGAHLVTGGEDIFSKAPLSLTEARRPRKLVIGQCIGDIWPMIRLVLSRQIPKIKGLPHPTEDRAMTYEENKKFLNDVQSFLGIHNLESISSSEPEVRMQAFLDRLPKSIVKKYDLDRE